MKYDAIKDILDVVRGKAEILEVCLYGVDPDVSVEMKRALNNRHNDVRTSYKKGEETVQLHFKGNFWLYANWLYEECVSRAFRSSIQEPRAATLTARCLFFSGNPFTVQISESGISIEGEENIDETILLDIQRYIEQKKCEVRQ